MADRDASKKRPQTEEGGKVSPSPLFGDQDDPFRRMQRFASSGTHLAVPHHLSAAALTAQFPQSFGNPNVNLGPLRLVADRGPPTLVTRVTEPRNIPNTMTGNDLSHLGFLKNPAQGSGMQNTVLGQSPKVFGHLTGALGGKGSALGQQSPLKRGHAMLASSSKAQLLPHPQAQMLPQRHTLIGSGGSLPVFNRFPTSLSADSTDDTSQPSPLQVCTPLC